MASKKPSRKVPAKKTNPRNLPHVSPEALRKIKKKWDLWRYQEAVKRKNAELKASTPNPAQEQKKAGLKVTRSVYDILGISPEPRSEYSNRRVATFRPEILEKIILGESVESIFEYYKEKRNELGLSPPKGHATFTQSFTGFLKLLARTIEEKTAHPYEEESRAIVERINDIIEEMGKYRAKRV